MRRIVQTEKCEHLQAVIPDVSPVLREPVPSCFEQIPPPVAEGDPTHARPSTPPEKSYTNTSPQKQNTNDA